MSDIDVLNVKMLPNDAGVNTVGEYLIELAKMVWIEDEGFNGKRPFGNSGWKHEVYSSLAAAGVIEGSKDVFDPDDEEYGWSWEYSSEAQRKADLMIKRALNALVVQ